jgi:molecular chaperone GrpE (heat shock protein)
MMKTTADKRSAYRAERARLEARLRLRRAGAQAAAIRRKACRESEAAYSEKLKEADEAVRAIREQAENTARRRIDETEEQIERMAEAAGLQSRRLSADIVGRANRELNTGTQRLLKRNRQLAEQLVKSTLELGDAWSAGFGKKYVLELVNLYNLIADGCAYHGPAAEAYGGADYKNCVESLREYLSAAADMLLDMGAQELLTDPGQPFDSTRHEPWLAPSDFDPKAAVVKHSLRSGFSLNGAILQKERVQLYIIEGGAKCE